MILVKHSTYYKCGGPQFRSKASGPAVSLTYSTWLSVLLASTLLLLTGCIPDYKPPQGWGSNLEKILPNGCPDLSGTYGTRAVESYPEKAGTPPRLHEILGSGGLSDVFRQGKPWPPALPGATTASFTSDGDWVSVQFGDDAGGAATLRFKRMHWWGGSIDESDAMYHCLQFNFGRPAMVFEASKRSDFAAPDLTQYYEDKYLPLPRHVSPDMHSVLLSKGEDDSLIVNFWVAYSTVPSLGPLPIGYSEKLLVNIWWRYPLTNKKAKGT